MLAVSLLMGCTSSPYRPTLCTGVNFNLLDCTPTEPSKQRYDLKTNSVDFLGMICMPEADAAEGKKRLKYILEGLN